MKLIGNLKKKVENAETKEDAQETIKKAGMLLDDDELEQVSGGTESGNIGTENYVDFYSQCEKCPNGSGSHAWCRVDKLDWHNVRYQCQFCKRFTIMGFQIRPIC